MMMTRVVELKEKKLQSMLPSLSVLTIEPPMRL